MYALYHSTSQQASSQTCHAVFRQRNSINRKGKPISGVQTLDMRINKIGFGRIAQPNAKPLVDQRPLFLKIRKEILVSRQSAAGMLIVGRLTSRYAAVYPKKLLSKNILSGTTGRLAIFCPQGEPEIDGKKERRELNRHSSGDDGSSGLIEHECCGHRLMVLRFPDGRHIASSVRRRIVSHANEWYVGQHDLRVARGQPHIANVQTFRRLLSRIEEVGQVFIWWRNQYMIESVECSPIKRQRISGVKPHAFSPSRH